MLYTITISDLTFEQLHNLNNRLSYVNSGASATSIDDEGKKWRVSVTTSDFNTQQVLANITGVLSQAVVVPYYTINQLPATYNREYVKMLLMLTSIGTFGRMSVTRHLMLFVRA